MRPFVAELVGMGFGPAEAMVLDVLKQAKGNKLTALAMLREQQPEVVERAIFEAIDELMEMGFGPRPVVVEALRIVSRGDWPTASSNHINLHMRLSAYTIQKNSCIAIYQAVFCIEGL